MLGCDENGELDEAQFSKPMPWIGVYIAGASLACAIAMVADAVAGFRYRRLWFPSRYFALNAMSLSVIAVAIKLSVDLNTPMPGQWDQLAKLSSSVLICTVMGNSMPSIGSMRNKELLPNMIALAILVITSIVNICMQLGTGVIFEFRREHAFVMFLMLLLLVMLSFSAVVVPTTKCYLEMEYRKKHELALKESSSRGCKTAFDKLKEDLMKYWMMAHTCDPQFVVGRYVTCTASGALCLLGAVTLAQAMLRGNLMNWKFDYTYCHEESDYKWSSLAILIAQNVAVGVGTIAPALRWLLAINFKSPKRGNKSYKDEFKLEKYWIECLIEIKECSLSMHIPSRQCRTLIHSGKRAVLEMVIGMQFGVVLGSKAVRMISILFMSRIFLLCDLCCELRKKFLTVGVSTNGSDSSLRQEGSVVKPDLSRYVLHLEGEEELVYTMMQKNQDTTEFWIERGKQNQPKHLIQLLEETRSRLFEGVMSFDSDVVPPLDYAEPPNNWALPIITLMGLGLAIPNIDPCAKKRLLRGVREGLIYVNLVEERLLCAKQELMNARKAASMMFPGVDLYHKWLDVDLQKISLQGETTKHVLEALASAAKNIFVEFEAVTTDGGARESPSEWPVKVQAAYSMYRISETLLLDCKSSDCDMSERIFEKLSRTIFDIIAACLTNLEHLIFIECSSSGIEKRQERMCFTALLLGKTTKIMEILNQRELPCLDSDQRANINEWRASGDTEKGLIGI